MDLVSGGGCVDPADEGRGGRGGHAGQQEEEVGGEERQLAVVLHPACPVLTNCDHAIAATASRSAGSASANSTNIILKTIMEQAHWIQIRAVVKLGCTEIFQINNLNRLWYFKAKE